MPYKVHIRKVETGEVRVYEIEWDWYKNGPEGDRYWWAEGNFGCDCNRELSWLRAGGENREMGDVKCSHGRFEVDLIELPSGATFELDD